ncbi:hypothetical protein Golax_010120 [Gossypium laxum]|uniref:Uncharacterized protein n=1 Tax=Gossypium laxum TaxID=34288 RepID=A0A7J8ZGK6_9ROSI|nr:hypothetical protein [Gossypium laxum]
MDVANGYYLVRFQSKVDYDTTLTQDQSSHGGGENSTSLTIKESMPVKTGEFSVTMAKPLERLGSQQAVGLSQECLGSQQAVGISQDCLES